jgi:cytochrome c-type biogenesis protein CcmF
MFFLFLMIAHNNPFATYLTDTPRAGAGLNPLLQNFYMAIHPPTMYLGFVGMTIPFAFCIAALVTGHLDDSWLRAVRRWTMVSWFCLSLGLTLGMIWAYEELGWGGFWGWDPVENAGLLPWFTATAFLHSVMVQERRGMLRVWNVTLVITTFFLTLFGTFMTRSGVVQSVHAFGEDKQLAMMFMVFMSALLIFSFGWVIYRLPLLKARNELDSWTSKEAAFLANNWVLLFSALFVLFATMFPTITEAITGERLTVGPPFFNTWMTPVGLILLLLTGVGPLLAWRSSPSARCGTSSGGRSCRASPPACSRCRSASACGARGSALRSAVRDGHDRAGVRARRRRAAHLHRHGSLHGDGRPREPQQAPLRRLHRARRHRADVHGFCR